MPTVSLSSADLAILVSEISRRFLAEDLDRAITDALHQVGEQLGAERSYLFAYTQQQQIVVNTHEWCAPGIPPQQHLYRHQPVDRFPWLHDQVKEGLPVTVDRIADLPPEAIVEQASWQQQRIQSILYVPILYQDQLQGAIGMETLQTERSWQAQDLAVLATVGEIIAMAQSRRAAEQAQSNNQALLNLALQAADMGAWEWNLLSNVEIRSPEMSRLLGRTNHECSFEEFLTAVHPEDRDHIYRCQQDALVNRTQYHCEYRVIWPDNSVHWLSSIGNYQWDSNGQAISLSGISMDITQRKAAALALEISEERYRLTMESLNEGIWDWDLVTHASYYSPQWKTLLGYGPEELPNVHQIWEELLHPEDRGATQALMTAHLRGETPTYEAEFRLLHKNGSYRWILSRGKVVKRDPVSGQPLRILGSHTDITERKQNEQHLRQQQAFLKRLIDTASDLIVVKDWDNQVILINQAAIDFYDLTPTTALGDHSPFFDSQEWQEWTEQNRQIMTSGDDLHIHEEPFVDAAGKTYWLQWLKRAMRMPGTEDPCVLMIGTDITNRKRIELLLQQQWSFLRRIIDASPDMILVKTIENRIVLANQAVAQFYGLDLEYLQHSGTDESDRYSPEVLAQFRAENRLVIEENQDLYLPDQEEINAAGESRWVQWMKRPLQLPGRDDLCVLLVGFDITVVKQAQIQAQESAALFQKIFQNAPIGITLDDLSGRTLEVNPALETILGYSADQLKAMNYRDYTHSDDLTLEDEPWQSLLEGKYETYELEKRCIHQQGHRIWVRLSVSLLRDHQGDPYLSLGLLQDITATKHQQEFLRTLIDTCPDLIVVRDRHHRVVVANQTYADFYHQSLAEIIGATGEIELPPAIWSLVESENNHILATGAEFRGTDGAQLDAKGVEHYLRWVKRVVAHPSQEDICILQVGTDITEIKEAELTQRQAREAAESASKAKSTFLATMSHELRTPLNGILGYAQILRRDPALTPRQQEGVRIIEQCGNHLLTLINDVLDIAKVEAERLELDPKEFHFAGFLTDIAEVCRLRAEQKGIGFGYTSEGILPTLVVGDDKRLRQILLNLLSNAIKFTKEGQVTFMVSSTALVSPAAPEAPGRDHFSLSFRIADTGVGIPAEQLERIFLPFEQVGERTQRAEGTGLGLTITQNLVHLMGGHLQVESQPGMGSTFAFRIALAAPEESRDPATLLSSNASHTITGYTGVRRRILVIDDRQDNRTVIAGLLEPLGFEVQQASNGQEGIDAAFAWEPDLVLCDLIMPVMDGFEVIRHLRQHPVLRHGIAIASSASVMEFTHQKSQQFGYDSFLPKPVHIDELLRQLQHYLQLEWIYLAEPTQSGQMGEDEDAGSLPRVIPPADELVVLYEAAQVGRIQRITQEAHRLANLDPRYYPFASQLLRLAEELDDEAIVSLLKPYVTETLL